MYDWGSTALFAGVGSPLSFSNVGFIIHGQKLEPTGGGQAAAGYASSPAANEAAIVIGNSGRTVLNGFVLEEATVTSDAVRLAQNEIQFLLAVPPVIESMSRSGSTFTLTWSAVPGQTYWLQYTTNLTPANWTDVPPAVVATGPNASATDTNAASQRFYRVRLGN